MPSKIQPVTGLLKDKAAAAALAVPATASDGVDVSTWRTGSTPLGFVQALIAIDSDASTTLTSPTLYGYGPYGPSGASQWFVIGTLNGGTAIALTAAVGFAQMFQFPCVFTRLAVGATVSAGNVGYTATPVMVSEL